MCLRDSAWVSFQLASNALRKYSNPPGPCPGGMERQAAACVPFRGVVTSRTSFGTFNAARLPRCAFSFALARVQETPGSNRTALPRSLEVPSVSAFLAEAIPQVRGDGSTSKAPARPPRRAAAALASPRVPRALRARPWALLQAVRAKRTAKRMPILMALLLLSSAAELRKPRTRYETGWKPPAIRPGNRICRRAVRPLKP